MMPAARRAHGAGDPAGRARDGFRGARAHHDRYLARAHSRGMAALVSTRGGRLAPELKEAGGELIRMRVDSKNRGGSGPMPASFARLIRNAMSPRPRTFARARGGAL